MFSYVFRMIPMGGMMPPMMPGVPPGNALLAYTLRIHLDLSNSVSFISF